MQIADKIIAFGEKFEGRLDSELLNYALDYVNHNEPVLAFETVCDHLCDYDVSITKDEYNMIIALAEELKLNAKSGRYLYLEKISHPNVQ